jgi:hypothetical protein
MGLFFGEVVESWVEIIGEKVFCVADGVKLFCVVDVGSWQLFLSTFKELVVTPNIFYKGLI